MIDVDELTKRYDAKLAVDGLTFAVRPGVVTGFLGPNGAGKSTTMRMIMGLDHPTSGSVTVNGRAYADHAAPLQEVGVLLEARAYHPGRSARNHLRAMALTCGIGNARVDEVLDLVGLTGVAGQRVGGFSLGMGQRLGIAAALLGDPEVLILDEPVNGLDLDGIRWIRGLLRRLADEGRTVFLSSHLMSEMALTADHVIVIGKGRLLRDQPMADFIKDASVESVRVVTPDEQRLRAVLEGAGAAVTSEPPGHRDDPAAAVLDVTGMRSRDIGATAAREGVVLWELSPHEGSLEQAYLALTGEVTDHAGPPDGGAGRRDVDPADLHEASR